MVGLPRFVVDALAERMATPGAPEELVFAGPQGGAGANPKEVAARAGHASVSFTLDRYGHLYPEADLSLRERLDAIWSASGGGS